MLSEKLCDNQLNWLERHLSKGKENIENFRRLWHRVYGNLSQESEDITKKLRDYGMKVISLNDLTHFPYVEIKVNRLEFDGLNQITKYFSILDKFLGKTPPSN